MIHHAVVTREGGGAIVTSEWEDETKVVVGIERYPYAIEPLAVRVGDLREDDPACEGIVDGEGLGDALWELLGKPRRPWTLYSKHGPDRAELTRVLLVGVARKSFAFAPGLDESEAMKKALLSLTRNPREDGPGSELAVALALSVGDFRRPVPRIY